MAVVIDADDFVLRNDPDCPIRRLSAEIGPRWHLLVLMALSVGPTRHNVLLTRIEGISPKMLSVTLKAMQRDGFIDRTVYPEVPPRVEYQLTELGAELKNQVWPVIQWNAANLEQINAAQEKFDKNAAKLRVGN